MVWDGMGWKRAEEEGNQLIPLLYSLALLDLLFGKPVGRVLVRDGREIVLARVGSSNL